MACRKYDEHRKGDPRDKEDREILKRLFGRNTSFVELHELWLKKEYRGKGYGKRFFDFFEEFVKRTGHDSIVYYAFDSHAIGLCRKRGYKEATGLEVAGRPCYVFYKQLRV